MPRTPKRLDKVIHRGINNRPLCRQEISREDRLFPMLWNSIVVTTDTGRKRMQTHIIRSASLPISTTAASVRKSEIICGAKMKHTAEIIPINALPKARVNSVPARTLEYFLAP